MKRIGRVKRVCLLALAGLLIFTPLILSVGAVAMLRGGEMLGIRLFHVVSTSMEPAFNKGDLIVVTPCTPEDVQVGDDITYGTGLAFITRRVKEILTELDGEPGLWFVTQGVNNAAPDYEPVEASQLVGKVRMRLPSIGAALDWVRREPGRLMAALPAALLLCALCWLAGGLLIWLAVRGRRHPSKQKG